MKARQYFTVILPLLLGAACEPGARVSVATALRTPLDSSMLFVTITDGNRFWEWHGADLRSSAALGMPHSPERATRTRGDLLVSFRVHDTAQGPVATGSVTIPLRNDWRWRVDFINATEDPVLLCFGCAGSRAFALPPTHRAPGFDSLWVVWGGNSISDPVIY